MRSDRKEQCEFLAHELRMEDESFSMDSGKQDVLTSHQNNITLSVQVGGAD